MSECQSTETMGARFTPLAVEMMIHFHTSAAPFDRLAYPACMETLHWMLKEQLVEPADHGLGSTYRPTSRGQAWAWMLCNTPLPELEWIDRRQGASRPTLWIEAHERRARLKAERDAK